MTQLILMIFFYVATYLGVESQCGLNANALYGPNSGTKLRIPDPGRNVAELEPIRVEFVLLLQGKIYEITNQFDRAIIYYYFSST